jgi:hypothetical protein
MNRVEFVATHDWALYVRERTLQKHNSAAKVLGSPRE